MCINRSTHDKDIDIALAKRLNDGSIGPTKYHRNFSTLHSVHSQWSLFVLKCMHIKYKSYITIFITSFIGTPYHIY